MKTIYHDKYGSFTFDTRDFEERYSHIYSRVKDVNRNLEEEKRSLTIIKDKVDELNKDFLSGIREMTITYKEFEKVKGYIDSSGDSIKLNFEIKKLNKKFSIILLNKISYFKTRKLLSELYLLNIETLDDNKLKIRLERGLDSGKEIETKVDWTFDSFVENTKKFINKVALGIVLAFVVMYVLKYYGYWFF